MAEIRWTVEAETWLKDIFDYVAAENRNAATLVVQGIYDRIQTLSQFPEMGYAYQVAKGGEIRILLYGHYRIAYLHEKEKSVVHVLGIFHGALDIDRYIP